MKYGEKLCHLASNPYRKPQSKICFEYRKDPVPSLLKWNNSSPGRPKLNNEMRQTTSHEKTIPVKIRAKRNFNSLLDYSWFHYRSKYDYSWKNKKIKKQWMKNL